MPSHPTLERQAVAVHTQWAQQTLHQNVSELWFRVHQPEARHRLPPSSQSYIKWPPVTTSSYSNHKDIKFS